MEPAIAIVDYGLGNLRSVEKAVARVGGRPMVTPAARIIEDADGVILPGVGAFGPAIVNLQKSGLWEAVKKRAEEAQQGGRPFLGICLGIQLLFSESEETRGVNGLGILKGKVLRFRGVKTPQIGWNRLHLKQLSSPFFQGVSSGGYAYFVHSYYVQPEEEKVVAATASYGIEFTAAIQEQNLVAVQFHLEKSGEFGLRLLKNFLAMVAGERGQC